MVNFNIKNIMDLNIKKYENIIRCPICKSENITDKSIYKSNGFLDLVIQDGKKMIVEVVMIVV